jgi:hypothetical protein
MSNERPFASKRRDAGLCLGRAAVRLRISPRYLHALERGLAPLSQHLVQRMATEYGTTIDDLTRPGRAGGTVRRGR